MFLPSIYWLFLLHGSCQNNRLSGWQIPQFHFYCIFKSKIFKNFQIFEIFRKPRAFGARLPTFGGLRPPKVGLPASREKFGGRLPEIAEFQPSTEVLASALHLESS